MLINKLKTNDCLSFLLIITVTATVPCVSNNTALVGVDVSVVGRVLVWHRQYIIKV